MNRGRHRHVCTGGEVIVSQGSSTVAQKDQVITTRDIKVTKTTVSIFVLLSVPPAGKYWDNTSNYASTISFHIFNNLLFTNHVHNFRNRFRFHPFIGHEGP
jgi:hypothetical protein